jgi:hypothetical protein
MVLPPQEKASGTQGIIRVKLGDMVHQEGKGKSIYTYLMNCSFVSEIYV